MKSLLLFLVIILCTPPLSGQRPVLKAIAGVNMANWGLGQTNNLYNANFRIGAQVGATATFAITDRIAVEPGLAYGMFGSIFKNNTESSKYHVNYLLIPLMVQYEIRDGITVHGGPQMGIMLKANQIYNDDNFNFKFQMNTMDIFIALGGAYRVHPQIEIGLRYQHGLINSQETLNLDKAYNRAILLFGTYLLN